MNLVFDQDGAAIPEGWTEQDVKASQERTIQDILAQADQPLTIEQIVKGAGGMAEVYVRETVARLQAKFGVFILGDRICLFERTYL